MSFNQLPEESRQKHSEIILLVFTICIEGNTTDLPQFLSNSVEFLSNIALDHGVEFNVNGIVWDISFTGLPTEIDKEDLVASIDRAGIRIEFKNWVFALTTIDFPKNYFVYLI